jgi:hypothetical protein
MKSRTRLDMRRLALIAAFVVVACAVLALGAVLFVDRALAAAPRTRNVCLNIGDRERIASAGLSKEKQDALVTKSLNFDQGVPRSMAWWHLRGAAIHATYVTFWSSERRSREFKRIVSEMADCRWN